MGKIRSKNKGEGQKVSSERPNANQIPSTCVLGCIFSFLLLSDENYILLIRWKLYSPENRKALKPQGPHPLLGWLGSHGQR